MCSSKQQRNIRFADAMELRCRFVQDKILQSQRELDSTGEIMVTNDGATILKSIGLENPAAKILVGMLWSSPQWHGLRVAGCRA
jgi:hypothetical protein